MDNRQNPFSFLRTLALVLGGPPPGSGTLSLAFQLSSYHNIALQAW